MIVLSIHVQCHVAIHLRACVHVHACITVACIPFGVELARHAE